MNGHAEGECALTGGRARHCLRIIRRLQISRMPDRCSIFGGRALLAASVAWLVLAFAGEVGAAEPPKRLEIWGIKLGTSVARLPDAFVDYACGTNGGPPSVPLAGWRDFKRCRPDASGLREVYFRYDDELEYWAKANDLLGQMEQYAGTRAYGFPIIASILIDADGIVRGIRIVSDPRDENQNRDEAYLLKNFLTARFGRDGWNCEDLAAAPGETPVDGVFVKQDCRKQVDGDTSVTLSAHYLRKPGQSRFDPHSGKQTNGQFESSVRFELVRNR
jgi:hypothetical protein